MTTKALLVLFGDQVGRMASRRDALVAAGASNTADWTWYMWDTVTAARSERARRVLIAADPDCTPEDWASACNLLRQAGYMGSDPRYDDIGEPGRDPVSRAWLWVLTTPQLLS